MAPQPHRWSLRTAATVSGQSDAGEKSDHSFVGTDHPFHVIAVHGIDTHQQGGLQLIRMLTIPTESQTFEAVRKGDEAAIPVCVVHIENIDVCFPESMDSCLNSLLDARQARGIDDA